MRMQVDSEIEKVESAKSEITKSRAEIVRFFDEAEKILS